MKPIIIILLLTLSFTAYAQKDSIHIKRPVISQSKVFKVQIILYHGQSRKPTIYEYKNWNMPLPRQGEVLLYNGTGYAVNNVEWRIAEKKVVISAE